MSRRKTLFPKPEVHLHSYFTALQTEEEKPVTSLETLKPSKAAQSAPRTTTSTTKKKQQVIVVDKSLLRGMEAPIY